MNTEEFIRKTAGHTGVYCLWTCLSHPSKDQSKSVIRQFFYPTIPELLTKATELDAKGVDTYFACGEFKDSSSRKAHNVATMSSLYLDVDCGADKPYASAVDGLKALRGFCSAYKLPTPLMVSSGRGVHVYWLLDTPEIVDVWKPVAIRLKAACREYGLHIDTAVTADAARVLRIPGTHHHKDEPKLVTILGTSWPDPIALAAFGDLIGMETAPAGLGFTALQLPDSAANAVMTNLMGNTQSSFKEILSKSINGKGCEQLRLIVTDQATCSEPMWRAGLSIAKFCDEPAKGARVISSGHPEYSAEATAKKLEDIKGPYTCVVFDDNNADVCPGCRHWGKITSPIQLGKYVVEAAPADNIVQAPAINIPNAPVITYEIPKYPFPYFRGATGGVYLRKKNDEGETEDVAIYHNDLYVVKRLRDVEIGECVVMRLHLPRDGVREFMLPLASVTSKEELRRELSKQGVAVAKTDSLLLYITTWINNLQETTMADDAHRAFGWVGRNFDQFIAGPYDIRVDRVLVNHPTSATAGLMDAFIPKGTLAGWKEAIKFYDRPGYEVHQYVICRAFGSLLMELTQYHGSTLHLYDKEGGRGKTTSALAGLSVYGDPEKLRLKQKDTMASRMNRAEVYHNLMFFVDEITNGDGREHSDFAYQVTEGGQRNRMQGNVNTERQRAAAWYLLATTTGNTSMIEQISAYKTDPKAEMMRVLEHEVPKLLDSVKDKAETDTFNALLAANYGHALLPFVQHVMRDPERVRGIFTKVANRLDISAGLGPMHRFWSTDGSMTLLGGLVAQEVGLLPFNMQGLYRYTVNLIQDNKRAAISMGSTTQEAFNEFVFEHMANMLQIQSTVDRRDVSAPLVVPSMVPKGALIIRYETDTQRAYVITKNLRSWCVKQQINYTSFVRDLIETMDGKREKMRLSKGTALQMSPTNVISVSCNITEGGQVNGTGTEDEPA
jgi:hypothetical protein